MDEIKEWAEKKMFISIFSIVHNGRIEWTAGVRVGFEDKNNWLPSKDEGCQFSSYLTYDSALQHAVDYCKNYKPKATRTLVNTKKKKWVL